VIRAVAPLLVAALALSACQTTQELSAQKAKEAKKLVNAKGLTVSKENPNVAVGTTSIVQDANGIAAVVELKNTGKEAQAGLPVSIAVTDAKGKQIYKNDVAGLEDSLVSLSLLGKGEDAFWVDNQITATGKPAKVQARVGAAKGKVPAQIPAFVLSGLTLESDAGSVFAKGSIVNQSKVAQKRLTIYCVARKDAKVTAAGRGILDVLPPAGAKPTKFTVFFIGNPKGARLSCSAPPTVLQ
jgi:hypothetical protein